MKNQLNSYRVVNHLNEFSQNKLVLIYWKRTSELKKLKNLKNLLG